MVRAEALGRRIGQSGEPRGYGGMWVPVTGSRTAHHWQPASGEVLGALQGCFSRACTLGGMAGQKGNEQNVGERINPPNSPRGDSAS